MKGIVHAGIAVKDLSVSIPFYRDVLGLELIKEEEVRKTRGEKLSVPGAVIQICVFRIPNTDTEIELIEYKYPPPMFNYGVPVNIPGQVHIAFKVNNIEEKIKQMKKAGVAFCSENYDVIKDGPLKGWKWIYFKDPDGTNLELIEEVD
ncbi:MAG: hypothetical protein GX076_09340 [Clostridiales bacterium]|nr:hypothetical protein [Clostridiales bacterium]